MPVDRLCKLLNESHIPYDLVEHFSTYTTAATGSITHIPGRELAKPVMVRVDGAAVMAVVPGSRHLDLKKFKDALGAKSIHVMAEDDFANAFPDCELGAMPPFGMLYGLPVYVDERLTHEKDIFFNSGSHRELVRVAYKDFDRIQHPKVLHIASATAGERLDEDRLIGPYPHL